MLAVSLATAAFTAPKKVVYIGCDFAPTRVEFSAIERQMSLQGKLPGGLKIDFPLRTALPTDYEDAEMVVYRAIQEQPDVIVTVSSGLAVEIKRQTNRIPIVFSTVIDPREIGLSNNLNRPNSNATGVSLVDLAHHRRLQILQWAYPGIRTIGVMAGQSFLTAHDEMSQMLQFSHTNGIRILFVVVETSREAQRALRNRTYRDIDAWYFPDDFKGLHFRNEIVDTVGQLKVPSIFAFKDAVVAGAALAYAPIAPNRPETMARMILQLVAGMPLDRIPIEQNVDYRLVANAHSLRCVSQRISPRAARLISEYVRADERTGSCSEAKR